MILTEAWVLETGAANERAHLSLQEFTLENLLSGEVLVEPLYGCWEGNMEHALRRSPLDVCATRNEPRVVLGNSGVVRVLETSENVRGLCPGDLCIVFCNGETDAYGYARKIYGYDARNTVGVLAKRTKLRAEQLIKLSPTSGISPERWAGFSLRYITAWANWRVAKACWLSQMADCPTQQCDVVAWGGGVAFAELSLAKLDGHPVAMVASRPARLALIQSIGMRAINRAAFDSAQFHAAFLTAVRDATDGRGAAILIDNIGENFSTTLKALARQGVITTSGWKHGLTMPIIRSNECILRHIHVFTHFARYEEGLAAVHFAEQHGWAPPPPRTIYSWSEIPELAAMYAAGGLDDYFPTYAINGASTSAPR